MKDKNRFSQLLEHLMTMADLKNSTLARALQYDVSYISKWTSGRVLPAEKNTEKLFHEISHCIVSSMSDECRKHFYLEYQVENDQTLEQAIFDNLDTEYAYVRDRGEPGSADSGVKTSFFPELTLPQFIAKMRHPDLRKVKDLEVVAVIDILRLDHDYQLMIAELENRRSVATLNYPGVHFSMMINLDNIEKDVTYNAVFLMNLLTNLSNVDFQIYGNSQAMGKIVFTVKDAYCISGMIVTGGHCLAVSTSEDKAICGAMYSRLKTFCTKEALLVRKTTVEEMLSNHDYIQSVLSHNPQWLIGRMTEHLVPEDLYEELAVVYGQQNPSVKMDELRKIHTLTKSVTEEAAIQILIHEDAFLNFAVSGVLDFYNYKITLTPEQRLKYMRNLLILLEKNPKLDIKLIRGGLITDFQHIPNPTLFLTNALSYLRLERKGNTNNISILNKISIRDAFRRFFQDVWTNYEDVEGRDIVLETTRHMIRSIEILDRVDSQEP